MFRDLTYRALSAIYNGLHALIEFTLNKDGYPIYGLLLVSLIHTIGLSIMVSPWCLLLIPTLIILFVFSVAIIEYANGLCDAITIQRDHIEVMERISGSGDESVEDILQEMHEKVTEQGYSSVSEYFRALEGASQD